MSDSLHPNWLAETLSSEVLTNLPCRKCGYNLRTLSTAGLCPECTTPVALSLRQDLLRYADPAWLASLRGGLFQFRWSLLLAIFVGFVLVIHGGIYPIFGPFMLVHFRNSASLIPLFAYASELIAIWRITTPDPAGIGEEKWGVSRRACRVLLLSQPAAVVAISVMDSTAASPQWQALSRLGWVGCAEIGVVLYTILARYLSHLAMRIPQPDIARKFQWLAWSVGVLGAIAPLLLLRRFWATSMVVFLPAIPAIWFLRMIDSMHATLKEEAGLAKQSLPAAPRQ